MTFFWICAGMWLIAFIFNVVELINWNRDMDKGELDSKWQKVSWVSFWTMIAFAVMVNVINVAVNLIK